MPKIGVRDIDIYYEIKGKGDRLLYIGGTGSDLRNKPNVFDSPLVDYFELLAYDQRGFGQSSKPDSRYTMAEYAADASELLHAVGWQQVSVVGVSFGGMVAQELLLRYPRQVTRAALLCTSSGGEGGDSYPLHELSTLSLPDRAQKLLELSDLRWNSKWQQENAVIFQALLKQRLSEMQAVENDPEMKLGAARQLEARIQHNTWDRLPNINTPTGVFGGRYDGIAPPQNLENLQQQIPDAILEMFEGGHFFFMQDPSAWPAVIRFLRILPASHLPIDNLSSRA